MNDNTRKNMQFAARLIAFEAIRRNGCTDGLMYSLEKHLGFMPSIHVAATIEHAWSHPVNRRHEVLSMIVYTALATMGNFHRQ